MTNYVCTELDQNSANGDGMSGSGGNYVMCKNWVAVSPSPLESLMITKDDALIIGGSLGGFFAVLIAFAIIVKGLKSM